MATVTKPNTQESLRQEIECIEACADRMKTIADSGGEYKESLDLLSQTLRIISKNALALFRLMEK